jgi:hypothetical protein
VTEMSELEQLAEDRDRVQLAWEQALVAESEQRALNRQLSAEIRRLRGEESGPGADEPEIAALQGSWPNVDDRMPDVGGDSSSLNDLVREAVSKLLPELLAEALPRRHGIDVQIPSEGRAMVPAEEVVARTYGAVVDTVAQLAARSTRVPTEDGFWSLGVDEEVSNLLSQVAAASPRRPKSQTTSRSLP